MLILFHRGMCAAVVMTRLLYYVLARKVLHGSVLSAKWQEKFFVLHDTYLLSSCYGGVYRPTCKLTCEEDRASVSPA